MDVSWCAMNIDVNQVAEIINNHPRFVSPFQVPASYYICLDACISDEKNPIEAAKRFCEKLTYAVKNTDELIKEAFRTEFYDFYGVDRDKVDSAEDMCRRLIFDSFVFNVEENETCAYLTNDTFMFGHFIEVRWNDEWNLIYSEIC